MTSLPIMYTSGKASVTERTQSQSTLCFQLRAEVAAQKSY